MGNPSDKPGRLAIVFFDHIDQGLMNALINVAESTGYKVEEHRENSVLLERGY